jgi:hypothetical protein
MLNGISEGACLISSYDKDWYNNVSFSRPSLLRIQRPYLVERSQRDWDVAKSANIVQLSETTFEEKAVGRCPTLCRCDEVDPHKCMRAWCGLCNWLDEDLQLVQCGFESHVWQQSVVLLHSECMRHFERFLDDGDVVMMRLLHGG